MTKFVGALVLSVSFSGFALAQSGAFPCTVRLSPQNFTVPSTGGTFTTTVTVSNQTVCAWAGPGALPSSVVRTSGTGSFIGNGTVTFSVLPNATNTAKNGALTVSGVSLGGSNNFFGQGTT